MVRFVVSSAIRTVIRDYNKKKGFEDSDDGYIDPESIAIEHIQLAHIASTLQATAELAKRMDYSLNNILKSTALYIEPKPQPKPNPEYRARMEALRRNLEEQEYNTLVRNVRATPKTSLFSDEDYSPRDAKMVKNQLSAIINILLSMISVFVAIFIWMKNSPDYLRLLWSLFFAAVVGVSEAGLYLLHWWHVEQDLSPKAIQAREKRKAIKQSASLMKKTQ